MANACIILNEIIRIFKGLLTPIIAIITAIILWKQFRLEKMHWRLALYDKRYQVYLATMEYLAFISQHTNATDDILNKFLRNSRDKEFLFGKDIQKFLAELYEQGVELNALVKTLEPEPIGEKRSNLVKEKSNLTKWFADQLKTSKTLFGKYLKIDKK